MKRPSFLLDTNVLLWAIESNARLTRSQREIVQDRGSFMVSVVSLWEIAIKRSTGKLKLGIDVMETLAELGIPLLRINEHHALRVEHLAHHHRDPFDRLMIAQAQVESLTIATSDRQFARYDVRIV